MAPRDQNGHKVYLQRDDDGQPWLDLLPRQKTHQPHHHVLSPVRPAISNKPSSTTSPARSSKSVNFRGTALLYSESPRRVNLEYARNHPKYSPGRHAGEWENTSGWKSKSVPSATEDPYERGPPVRDDTDVAAVQARERARALESKVKAEAGREEEEGEECLSGATVSQGSERPARRSLSELSLEYEMMEESGEIVQRVLSK